MCFDERKTPANIIVVMSILAAICGIIMIIFAVMLTGSDIVDQIGKETPDVKEARDLVFVMLLIFALLTILIAGLGFCLKCIENRIFTVIYGIILLPVWIVVIVVGIIAIAASGAAKDRIESECSKVVAQYTSEYDSGIGGTVTISLDIYESLKINTYMCSNDCPCIPTPKATEWTGAGITQRTFNFAGTLKTYKDCINDPSNGGVRFQTFANEIKNDTENYALIDEWVTFFETEYDCAGICKPALFAWSKSVEDGRPSQGCVGSIKDELTGSFTGLGAATLASGILLFLIFVMQYCLWKKHDD